MDFPNHHSELFPRELLDEEGFQLVNHYPERHIGNWLTMGYDARATERRPIQLLEQAPLMSMSHEERDILYCHWLRSTRDPIIKEIFNLHEQYQKDTDHRDRLRREVDLRCLHEANRGTLPWRSTRCRAAKRRPITHQRRHPPRISQARQTQGPRRDQVLLGPQRISPSLGKSQRGDSDRLAPWEEKGWEGGGGSWSSSKPLSACAEGSSGAFCCILTSEFFAGRALSTIVEQFTQIHCLIW